MMVPWWLCLAVCAFTPDNSTEVGGPLRLRNQTPLAMIFMSTPPIDARIPKHPTFDLDLTQTNSINFPDHMFNTGAGQQVQAAATAGKPIRLDFNAIIAQSGGLPGATLYIEDTETTRLGFIYRHPFGRRWLAEGEAPLYMTSGGFLDEVIKGWHSAFGFEDNGQHFFPRDINQVGFARGGKGYYTGGQTGPALGDVTGRALYNVVPGIHGWPTVSVSAALKAPTGAVKKLFGNGVWEGSLGLHFTGQLGQSWFYGTAGYNFHPGWRGMSDVVPIRNSLDLHFGYEYRVSKEWSVVSAFSYYGSSIRATEAQSLKNPATLYSFAARYGVANKYELEWGFIDNIARNNNALDFGIYSRLRLFP